jgi:GntR family transcriptional regulator, arabinose operon transcriptional repressor
MKKFSIATLVSSHKPHAGSKPKYQHVRDHLFAEISSGRLAPGEALPPEAKLAEFLGLSRNTVRLALGDLEDQGAVYRVQGRGTFVSTEQQRQSRKSLQAFALVAPELQNFFYPSLVAGFEEFCSSASFQTLVRSSANDVYRQGDQVLQLIDQRVSGVAIVPVTPVETPPHQIRQLHENHIPVVYCHRPVAGVIAPCVTWSGEAVGHAAAIELINCGHRNIAVFYMHEGAMAKQYSRGVRTALEERGIAIPNNFEIFYGASSRGPDCPNLIKTALTKLLFGPARPTALFCGNLPDAELVYLFATEMGLQVPQDLSIIHFGGTQRGGGLAQRLACVAVDEHQLGAIAGRLLTEMKSGKRSFNSDETVVLPVSFLPGETVASPQPLLSDRI